MSLQQLQDIAQEYYLALNTPLSLQLKQLVAEGKWAGVAQASTNPCNYTDPHLYRLDNFAVTLLKKCAGLPSGIDTRSAAMETWFTCEAQCFNTNQRLTADLFGDPEIASKADRFFRALRRHFYTLMGHNPPSFLGSARFGPGSTFEVTGRYISIPDKIATLPTYTSNAAAFITDFRETAWSRLHEDSFCYSCYSDIPQAWEYMTSPGPLAELPEHWCNPPLQQVSLLCVRGNRWGSVPKNALTDRSIGIEPGLNVFYQLGLGREMKRLLNRKDLLLRPYKTGHVTGSIYLQTSGADSQEIHRNLARLGSVSGRIATIDVRNASDTMCSVLIEQVTGPAWFKVLDALRSPYTFINDKWIRLEKFSSMGNGYTFELETAVFASIALLAAEQLQVRLEPGINFSVYGDDIIVPVEIAELVVQMLQYCGFETNSSKTYHSGPFRESCGGDFFDGYPVRGAYLKGVPSTQGDWMTFYNLVKRTSQYVPMSRVLSKIRDQIAVNLRCYGPECLGDVVLHHEHSSNKMRLRTKNSCRELQIVVPAVEEYPLERWGTLSIVASKLYGLEGDRIALRGEPIAFHTKWVPWS